MADILIERSHTLGLVRARKVARRWMQQAEAAYGLSCSYREAEEGEQADTAEFTRAGVDGRVEVGAGHFRLEATLGFLFAAFGEQISQRLAQSLDELLGAAKSQG